MSTVWNLVTSVLGSWGTLPPIPPDDLENDWEWMLSASEKLANSVTERDDVKAELRKIRNLSNTVSIRPAMQRAANDAISQIPVDVWLQCRNSRLDASKRDRICRDLIQETREWLIDLKPWMNLPEELEGQWYPQTYKKNLMGEMAVSAFRASHGGSNGLTVRVLADMIWSIYIVLARTCVEEVRVVDNPAEFSSLLMEKSIALFPTLIRLWSTTARVAGTIAEREGNVVATWRSEPPPVQAEVIGRFQDGPVRTPSVDAATYAQRRATIAANLSFTVRKT